MKLCVVKIDGKLSVHKTNSRHTKNCIAHLPSNTPVEDYKFVCELEDGTIGICKKKKSAWLKEQFSAFSKSK